MLTGPAIGLLELCSIARGVITCDAVVKRAPVRLVRSASTHPGKYVILIGGGVDEVGESLAAGEAVAGDALIDRLFLPNPHLDLVAVLEQAQQPPLEAVGVLESFGVAATVRAADAALKAADVRAMRLTLARDVGGKGFFVFTGLLHDVEAAMAAGRDQIDGPLLAGAEIVANPHPDLIEALA